MLNATVIPCYTLTGNWNGPRMVSSQLKLEWSRQVSTWYS